MQKAGAVQVDQANNKNSERFFFANQQTHSSKPNVMTHSSHTCWPLFLLSEMNPDFKSTKTS